MQTYLSIGGSENNLSVTFPAFNSERTCSLVTNRYCLGSDSVFVLQATKSNQEAEINFMAAMHRQGFGSLWCTVAKKQNVALGFTAFTQKKQGNINISVSSKMWLCPMLAHCIILGILCQGLNGILLIMPFGVNYLPIRSISVDFHSCWQVCLVTLLSWPFQTEETFLLQS